MSLPRERGPSAISRFVQQSPADQIREGCNQCLAGEFLVTQNNVRHDDANSHHRGLRRHIDIWEILTSSGVNVVQLEGIHPTRPIGVIPRLVEEFTMRQVLHAAERSCREIAA